MDSPGRLASLYLTKNVWEGVGAWYGIDSWLTTVAVAEGCEVSQGFLGTRIQDVKLTGIELSVVLAQAVGALFHLMEGVSGRVGRENGVESGPAIWFYPMSRALWAAPSTLNGW